MGQPRNRATSPLDFPFRYECTTRVRKSSGRWSTSSWRICRNSPKAASSSRLGGTLSPARRAPREPGGLGLHPGCDPIGDTVQPGPKHRRFRIFPALRMRCQERRLGRVLGILKPIEDLSADGHDRRPVSRHQRLEGRIGLVGCPDQEKLDQLLIISNRVAYIGVNSSVERRYSPCAAHGPSSRKGRCRGSLSGPASRGCPPSGRRARAPQRRRSHA